MLQQLLSWCPARSPLLLQQHPRQQQSLLLVMSSSNSSSSSRKRQQQGMLQLPTEQRRAQQDLQHRSSSPSLGLSQQQQQQCQQCWQSRQSMSLLPLLLLLPSYKLQCPQLQQQQHWLLLRLPLCLSLWRLCLDCLRRQRRHVHAGSSTGAFFVLFPHLYD
jgi:hypothetical protein